ncbi:MAG: aminomethyl-transferring glycine dehydrogenase subunit GcvPA [Candidatus Cloacimonetes bacterium]|nr:aminomethyl-transferring glycine dehydrogenase subunit GcvPA [Candidatus Cloacimonadota bacterium]
MPFISNTDRERKLMLQACGVDSFDDLIKNIPLKFRQNATFDLGTALSELELSREVAALASENETTERKNSFLGAGIYDHFVPAAVQHITSRPEFLSAYTPYQAEVSQGTLQYIYEYQTMICELTGMDIANAGMYDGASAAAEAVLMAVRKTKKYRALIPQTLNPLYRAVIKTYTEGVGVELVEVAMKSGRIDQQDLAAKLDDETACLVMQTPNFFGFLEDAFAMEKIVHSSKKALLIAVVDPVSLAVLNAPAEYEADIVVGEGQGLGNPQSYGGPLFGFLATRESLVRTMPGRLVGATLDAVGNIAYVLTLQAREQHIRREKATSNICSNDALCTLAATVHLCLLGKEGLKEVALQSTAKAHYLAQKLAVIPGFEIYSGAPFFKEFALKTPLPADEIIKKLQAENIYPGISLKKFGFEDLLLIAVTEKKTRKQMDELIYALQQFSQEA